MIMFEICELYLLSALTPVHVGVGRSPGSVDLPIARDGFGIPYIPGSGLKGSVKSLCLRTASEKKDCERVYGWDIRLGSEPSSAYASSTVFTDAYLLFYPVRADTEEGLRYGLMTSCLVLERAYDLIELCRTTCRTSTDFIGELRRLCEEYDGTNEEVVYLNNAAAPRGTVIEYQLTDGSAFSNAGNLVKKLSKNIFVVTDNEVFVSAVESGLLRQTRIRLDFMTKTVGGPGLWTEEYVSQGAVFIMSVLYRSVPGVACANFARNLNKEVLKKARHVLVVGGKETIGKGLVKLARIDCSG